jgi:hypothetical protein
VDEKDFDTLRHRYYSAVEACRGLFAKRDDQLADDEIEALVALEEARRDLLTALWVKTRDLH